MKFTDPLPTIPKKQPPRDSWWASTEVQTDREKFNQWALAEQQRIVGNERFGGAKKVHDKGFQKSRCK